MVKRGRKKVKKMKGGFIPALVAGATAVHGLATKFKPVSKLDDLLGATGLKSEGKSVLGKIANAGLAAGRAIGYGQSGGMMMPLMIPSAGRNQISTAGAGKMRMIKVI